MLVSVFVFVLGDGDNKLNGSLFPFASMKLLGKSIWRNNVNRVTIYNRYHIRHRLADRMHLRTWHEAETGQQMASSYAMDLCFDVEVSAQLVHPKIVSQDPECIVDLLTSPFHTRIFLSEHTARTLDLDKFNIAITQTLLARIFFTACSVEESKM